MPHQSVTPPKQKREKERKREREREFVSHHQDKGETERARPPSKNTHTKPFNATTKK